ncbi:hypothetical protein CYLTODRAFT_232691 [Cylindrobasidium torrendii FP15055 ss-10]|uniref:Uncharacterized protein n=1 Tax=Cylindrobasidium torrendii FP15055 ss-10 TaxID=1314674 RepID=A0A0D7BGW8_9AGAR|nr:hypothetical protein CYLTODRAFT_232691 [Cylindrobasidium torrendii FP15055 ss-10]
MALTQTATLPGPGPSWDEEVVPALRKRLESESRTIARRISAISVGSGEGDTTYTSGAGYYDHYAANQSYSESTPTRPSLRQQNRATPEYARATPVKSPSTRSRTYSQPWSPDGRVSGQSNGGASSPTTSARQDSRPTRIPKPARSRAGSTSSHVYASGSPYTSPSLKAIDVELMSVPEQPATASRSTLSVASRQDPRLLQEAPPFRANSATSSTEQFDNNRFIDPPRASVDSTEERPYEHWYRGDIARNGGVGELRVATRREMLDIANYGHAMRAKLAAQKNVAAERVQRRRADSLGPSHRQSFYMEDDDAKQVMDENPLTDAEGDASDIESDQHTNGTYNPYHENSPPGSASAPKLNNYNSRSLTPTPQRPSRIPTRQMTESPAPSTPIMRGASEPPPSTPKSSKSPKSPSAKAVKRAASPTTPPSATKSRTQASKTTRARNEAARKERELQEQRRSVGEYPQPGDDLRDAIPEWSQPVPRHGNWDDVVLPVVARKNGLDSYYETVDGSPKPKPVDDRIPPAPGTFGYDHTKYRPPRDMDPNDISMDEFGAPKVVEDEGKDKEKDYYQHQHSFSSQPTRYDQMPLTQSGRAQYPPHPPPSPVPFASYHGPSETSHQHSAPPPAVDQYRPPVQEEDSGGCCKCVVM